MNPAGLLNVMLGMLLAPGVSAQASDSVASVYTSLASAKCKAVEADAESGSSVTSCPGIAGYRLLLLDDDSRQSITVVTPDRHEHPLNYWSVVTPGFSSVGDKAEWRVRKQSGKTTPIALIVRVHALVDAGAPGKSTSYLVVAKIAGQSVCVVDRIVPGTAANEEARRVGDSSADAPCMKDMGER